MQIRTFTRPVISHKYSDLPDRGERPNLDHRVRANRSARGVTVLDGYALGRCLGLRWRMTDVLLAGV
jgi:hypothetical protein